MTGWEQLAVKQLLDRPIADLSLRQCWTLYLLSSLMYYSYDESLIRDNDFDNLCARLLTEMAVRPAEYTLYGLELYDPDALRAGSGYHVTPKTAPRAILQMAEFAHPTRRVAPMNQQPLPWSHSSLSTFTSCPKKFYHLKVVKDVVDDAPGEAALWGDYLHKAFEEALKTGKSLPTELSQYQSYIDKLVKLKGDGEAHVELKLGLNAQRGPTGFLADDVWSRGIIDYLVIRGSKAIVVDHKTGKVKPSKQLLQNALMIFAHYPQVDTVDVVFYWLKFDSKTHETFRRDSIPQMWSQYDQELASYALAFRQDIWPARQSGLCRGWCPVTSCPHWKPKK